MFKINKNNTEFLFYESKEVVSVFKSQGGEVTKISEFDLVRLSIALDQIKKEHPLIIKSKNAWFLNARAESVEKVPLSKEEMHSYAKWKIQDMVDVPMHDISYALLTNNAMESEFFKKHATAIIVKKSRIDFILKAFNNAKIRLEVIDSKATAILDFLVDKKVIEKKSLAFFEIEEDKAFMYVYYDSGLVFERMIEIPALKDLTIDNEEAYRSVIDKLCLEIQRNVDFLDRQHGIQHFENITYSFPEGEIFSKLAKELAEYFNVIKVDLSQICSYSPAFGEKIPPFVLGCFERGNAKEEHINLIPVVIKVTTFIDDFKKVVVGSLMLGLFVSVIGSYYEWKSRDIKDDIDILAKQKNKIEFDVDELKKQIITSNPLLEKEIDNLIRNKNIIIQIQSSSNNENIKKYEYPVILKDIAVEAKSIGVVLKKIKLNEEGLMLEGITKDKNLFATFLNGLKKAESLKGKSLSTISIDESGNEFTFRVSSSSMEGKK